MNMRSPRNFYVPAFKRDAGMLSCVADSLYWMGRYIERAEHTSRLSIRRSTPRCLWSRRPGSN